MQRGTDLGRVNAEADPDAPIFPRIRDGAYRLLLTRGALFLSALKTVTVPVWLHARARELSEPAHP